MKTTLVVLCLVLVAAAVGWNAWETRALAAEARYQNCVQVAQALPDNTNPVRVEYTGNIDYQEQVWKRVQECKSPTAAR